MHQSVVQETVKEQRIYWTSQQVWTSGQTRNSRSIPAKLQQHQSTSWRRISTGPSSRHL